MTEKNVEQQPNPSSDPLDRANDTHRAGLPLKTKTAAAQLGKGLDGNKTRSRPLPDFSDNETYNRAVPDGVPLDEKYARKKE